MARRSLRPIAAALILTVGGFGCGAAAAGKAPTRHAPAPAEASAPDPPAKPHGFAVAVLGGGYAEPLADGLREDLAADPDLVVLPEARGTFGLLDDAPFDPGATLRSLLAGRRPDAVAIMPGAGEPKPLPDGAALADPDTPRWRALYGNAVAALAEAFRAQHLPLIWVGLPVVDDDQLASYYAALNEIVRDRAVKAGAVYVDSWDAFADENGHFDANGPDKDGHVARLRGADGRTFTKAGAVKLARFAEPAFRRLQGEAIAAAAAATDVVLPSEPEIDADINAQIRRELGLPAAPGSGTPAAEPKPVAVIVTAPPAAPDGQLLAASIGPAPLPGTAGSLAQRALVEGRPIPPKPGRVDDFAWPRR